MQVLGFPDIVYGYPLQGTHWDISEYYITIVMQLMGMFPAAGITSQVFKRVYLF